MSTVNFNLRGIDDRVMSMLKKEAKKQHVSVNFLILNCIDQKLGYAKKLEASTYNDLDHLAGTWSKKDAEDFKENIKYFEKIDKELWS